MYVKGARCRNDDCNMRMAFQNNLLVFTVQHWRSLRRVHATWHIRATYRAPASLASTVERQSQFQEMPQTLNRPISRAVS